MFARIAKYIVKYRYPVIVTWVALLFAIVGLAPDLAKTATTDQGEFLRDSEPSVTADEVLARYFPDQAPPSMAVVVVESKASALRSETQLAYITELSDWLEHDFAPGLVTQVMSPAEPALANQLISADGQVGMIFVGFGVPFNESIKEAIVDLRTFLQGAPAGIEGYVTGEPALLYDYHDGAMESVDSTMMVTVVLIITTLLIIFRSPVSPLIPLTVISVTYAISRSLVAWLGDGLDFPISEMTDTFLLVIIFGAGTDYCLFLVSRFRGFMGNQLPAHKAAENTIGRVGETITSSAGTVVVGMTAMAFSESLFFANLGPSLALGVVVGLIAGLTLTPALLAVLGRWAFWPRRPTRSSEGGFWGRVADWVTARPWWRLALSVVLELPLAIYGLGMATTMDMLADLPDDIESKAAFEVAAEGFGQGKIQPLNVILTDIPDPRSSEGLAYINTKTREILEVEGVADVRSLALPMGLQGPVLTEDAGPGILEASLGHYASPTGAATLLSVALEHEPYAEEAFETVARLRDLVGEGATGYVQGSSATFKDLSDVSDRDLVRIVLLVLVGIAIVLVLLMRSLIAPLYMLLTILLSYATTLGLTRLVFIDIMGEQVSYYIPLILFVFLVALGMDYNIFLMGRVKEEVAKHGTRDGIRIALNLTGGVISSAGIIMAGTFGAMMTASIDSLVQMGFAVAVGVLLDTFLIRTTLLPAIAVLLDRWNWWPSRTQEPIPAAATMPAGSD